MVGHHPPAAALAPPWRPRKAHTLYHADSAVPSPCLEKKIFAFQLPRTGHPIPRYKFGGEGLAYSCVKQGTAEALALRRAPVEKTEAWRRYLLLCSLSSLAMLFPVP